MRMPHLSPTPSVNLKRVSQTLTCHKPQIELHITHGALEDTVISQADKHHVHTQQRS